MSYLNNRGIKLGRYDSQMPRASGAKLHTSGPVTISEVLAEAPAPPIKMGSGAAAQTEG